MDKILDRIACIVIILVLGIFTFTTVVMLFISFRATSLTILGYGALFLIIWAAIRVGGIMGRHAEKKKLKTDFQ